MPHVIVKLATGKSEEEKQALVDEVVRAVTATVNNNLDSVSVTLEEIPMSEWKEKVYDTDIQNPVGKLYKKPGYTL